MSTPLSKLFPAILFFLLILAAACGGGKSGDPEISNSLPLVPASLTASVLLSNHIQLHWLDPAQDEAGFIVARSMDGILFQDLALVPKNRTFYDDETVSPELTYFYRVRAFNKAGEETEPGNVAGAITMAGPTNLETYFADKNRVELTWSDNSSKEEGFRVERSPDKENFEAIAELPANSLNYSDTQVAPDQIYWYRVWANNHFGTSDPTKIVSSGHLFDVWANACGETNDDECASAIQTRDGGFVMAGSTTSFGAGDKDVWLVKSDPLGKSIFWQKSLGGALTDYATHVTELPDGRLAVTGTTASFAQGKGDLWLIMLDPEGAVLWEKSYHTIKDEFGYCVAPALSPLQEDSLIVAGATNAYSFNPADHDPWILHLKAADGSVIWQSHYRSLFNDEPRSIRQTQDGGFILAGFTENWGAGSADGYVIKLNSEGKIAWQYVFGGSGADLLLSIRQTQDMGYLAGGTTHSFGQGKQDMWLIKLSPSGQLEWSYTYGGAGDDAAHAILETESGEYLAAGYTGSYSLGKADEDAWLLHLGTQGNPVTWQFTYGGSLAEQAFSLGPAMGINDEGYILAGRTDSFGAGPSDFLALVVDKLGLIEFNTGSGAEVQATSAPALAAPVISELSKTYQETGTITILSTAAVVQDTQCKVEKLTP